MIFISYAREDHGYACKLYLGLTNAALDPWMDKPPHPYEDLGIKVGQKWRSVIDSNLRRADFVVLLLSPRSVKKRGYVQVEFRTALSLMNEMPDDQVFVIPIVTEKCQVPSLRVGQIDLLDLHWEEVKEADISAFAGRLAAGTKKGAP